MAAPVSSQFFKTYPKLLPPIVFLLQAVRDYHSAGGTAEGRRMARKAVEGSEPIKAEWRKPVLRRLEAGAAEDNPGSGSDSNGRAS
jgi:hypothetical protein